MPCVVFLKPQPKTVAVTIEQKGFWLQMHGMFLASNALEGTLPDSWENLIQARMYS